MKRLKTSEIAKQHGITLAAVRKKMARHGYQQDAAGTYDYAEYLKAEAAGMQADKAVAARQLAQAGDGETLQAQLLRRKIALLDIDIQTAQAKLDEITGNTVTLEHHKAELLAVQNLMLTWWDQASEAAATKIKDASVLAHLREARDRASVAISER